MNVGYKLYREVLDFAPAAVTSGELVVALVIADDASDRTRASWIPLPELCFKTRQQPSTVRANLAKLAARGLEFRVSHGTGKDGRPVFAARGHRTDYTVPDFLKGASAVAPIPPVDNSEKGASDVAPNERKALAEARKALAKPPKGASRLAPLPSIPSTTPQKEGLPVITPSVEGSPAAVDNGHFDFFAARSKT